MYTTIYGAAVVILTCIFFALIRREVLMQPSFDILDSTQRKSNIIKETLPFVIIALSILIVRIIIIFELEENLTFKFEEPQVQVKK